MDTLKQLINYFLVLIDVGAVARILYCFIRTMINPDEGASYFKKGKNLIIFMALANAALGITFLVQKYVS